MKTVFIHSIKYAQKYKNKFGSEPGIEPASPT